MLVVGSDDLSSVLEATVETKNPIVVQFIRLDASVGLQYMLESEEVGSNASEGIDLPAE